MTWIELQHKIEAMTAYQKETDVTIYVEVEDEWFPAHCLSITTDKQDVLDPDHPYLVIRGDE